MSREAPSINKTKSVVVQIRLDGSISSQIDAIAVEKELPPSTMLRDWVTDRLKQELRRVSSERSEWRTSRLAEVAKLVTEEFADGPILVVHAQPLTPGLKSSLDRLQQMSTSLVPLHGMQPVTGRINRWGYEATCHHHDKMIAKGQAFIGSQLESIYRLDYKGPEIFGLMLDEAIVMTVSSLLNLLSAQQFPLPYVFSVTLLRIKGSWLVTQASPLGPLPHVDFQEDSMTLSDILITDYAEASSPKVLAKHIRPILNEIWNASGISTSLSFDTDGTWHGPWR
jgi:hypothetical protein